MKFKKNKKAKKNGEAKEKAKDTLKKLLRPDPIVDPSLRFTPYAWAKLRWFRDQGKSEIGGFGITTLDDLLLIRDFVTVDQSVSWVSVEFDDESVADYFQDRVEEGLHPRQFGRIWLHTHPGSSPQPSCTDENTFERVFGHCDWAVMFILAEEGSSYARLRNSTVPWEFKLDTRISWGEEFSGTDTEAWEIEYNKNIHISHSVGPSTTFLQHEPRQDIEPVAHVPGAFGADGDDGDDEDWWKQDVKDQIETYGYAIDPASGEVIYD